MLALCTACTVQGGLTGYEQQWDLAEADPEPGHAVALFDTRLALIGSRRFTRLDEPTRHERLLAAAALAAELDRQADAHRLYVRASQMPSAGFDDWDGRLTSAAKLQDRLDVLICLTRIARSWPGALAGYAPEFIVQAAAHPTQRAAERQAAFELRLALYQARFTHEHKAESGELWALLAGDLLEHGRQAEAREVVSGIDSPRTLLSMRVDRRFDELVRQDPARFDVMAAAGRQISRYEQALQHQPRSLDALARLAAACLDAGRYEAVVRAVGAALGRMQDPQIFHAAYDDDQAALGSALESYARALMATLPWEDAAGAMELAAEGLEHGRPDLSNAINLGWFYARLGRPGEAASALAAVPPDAEAARMQWHAARVAAGLAAGDTQRARESLGILRQHRAEDPRAYEDALVRSGSEDAAARLLIARLRDPDLRRQALLDVQIYADPPAPPLVLQQRARWRHLIGRPDVQRAITRVGRLESWPLPPPELWESRGR